jgi:hypothetical protein
MVKIDEKDQWQYAADCINAALKIPEIRTIVIDSVTSASDMLIHHILKFGTKLTVAGRPTMEMQHWGPFQMIWKQLIMGIRASGKMLVVICHERLVEDGLSGATMLRPLIGGTLKDNLGGMFTDVWHAENRIKPDLKKPGEFVTGYYVRTRPTTQITLGTSLDDLPAEFEVTEEELMKRIPGLTPPAIAA